MTCTLIVLNILVTLKLCSGFCDRNYGNHKYTLCQFAPCNMVSQNCGSHYKIMPLNAKEIEEFIDNHNTRKNRVYLLPGYNQTKAKPGMMYTLKYDKELEFIPQCWANLCNAKGAHDFCRSITEIPNVGQNSSLMKHINEPVESVDILKLAF